MHFEETRVYTRARFKTPDLELLPTAVPRHFTFSTNLLPLTLSLWWRFGSPRGDKRVNPVRPGREQR